MGRLEDISSDLKREVESDIKGKEEKEVERDTIQALKELKNQEGLTYDEQYVKFLYKKNFRDFLSNKEISSENKQEILKKIQDKKQILAQECMEYNANRVQDPGFFSRKILGYCGISRNLRANSPIKNIIKGATEELCSKPDLASEFIFHPMNFVKGMWEAIKNPKRIWDMFIDTYGPAFTDGISTVEGQFSLGRNAVVLILIACGIGIGNLLKKNPAGSLAKAVNKVNAIKRNTINKPLNVVKTKIVNNPTVKKGIIGAQKVEASVADLSKTLHVEKGVNVVKKTIAVIKDKVPKSAVIKKIGTRVNNAAKGSKGLYVAKNTSKDVIKEYAGKASDIKTAAANTKKDSKELYVTMNTTKDVMKEYADKAADVKTAAENTTKGSKGLYVTMNTTKDVMKEHVDKATTTSTNMKG